MGPKQVPLLPDLYISSFIASQNRLRPALWGSFMTKWAKIYMATLQPAHLSSLFDQLYLTLMYVVISFAGF